MTLVKKRSWLGILASGLLALSLPGVAVAADNIEVLEGVATTIPVKDPATTPDFPAGSLSQVDCAVLVRTVAEDGSSQEFQSCTLSDEPVTPPEFQGAAPEATLTLAGSESGGECGWSSDYHTTKDGTDVWASAFEETVTPSGRVSLWSSYPAEPLDCTAQG